MVGTTGFEPATSRTPSVRATRLRHVPTDKTVLLLHSPLEPATFPASRDAHRCANPDREQESAYHSRSRRVKMERSCSRKSRSHLRCVRDISRSRCGEAEARGSSPDWPFCSARCLRAPAIVKPSS